MAELRTKGPRYVLEWAQARRDWQRELAAFETAGDAPAQFHDRAIEAAFRHAVETYDLQPWHGPLTLYRPPLDRHWKVSGGRWVSRAKEYVLDDNDWTRWAVNLDVVEVPGDHDSMVLEPHVRVLVRHLREQLVQADPETASRGPVWVPATAAE